MRTTFETKDLISGMIVETDDFEIGVVIGNRIVFNDSAIIDISEYDEKLEHKDDSAYSLCKVSQSLGDKALKGNLQEELENNLLWTRWKHETIAMYRTIKRAYDDLQDAMSRMSVEGLDVKRIQIEEGVIEFLDGDAEEIVDWQQHNCNHNLLDVIEKTFAPKLVKEGYTVRYTKEDNYVGFIGFKRTDYERVQQVVDNGDLLSKNQAIALYKGNIRTKTIESAEVQKVRVLDDGSVDASEIEDNYRLKQNQDCKSTEPLILAEGWLIRYNEDVEGGRYDLPHIQVETYSQVIAVVESAINNQVQPLFDTHAQAEEAKEKLFRAKILYVKITEDDKIIVYNNQKKYLYTFDQTHVE